MTGILIPMIHILLNGFLERLLYQVPTNTYSRVRVNVWSIRFFQTDSRNPI